MCHNSGESTLSAPNVSLYCRRWLLMCPMTHDSLTYATWNVCHDSRLTDVCDVTHSCVCRDSGGSIRRAQYSSLYCRRRLLMCPMTHDSLTYAMWNVCHESRLTDVCDVTHSCVCHDSGGSIRSAGDSSLYCRCWLQNHVYFIWNSFFASWGTYACIYVFVCVCVCACVRGCVCIHIYV